MPRLAILFVDGDDGRPLDQLAFEEIPCRKHTAAMPLDYAHPHTAGIGVVRNRHDVSIDSADAFGSAATAIEAAPVIPFRQDGAGPHVFVECYLVVHDGEFFTFLYLAERRHVQTCL